MKPKKIESGDIGNDPGTSLDNAFIYPSGLWECLDPDLLQHFHGAYPAGIMILNLKKQVLKRKSISYVEKSEAVLEFKYYPMKASEFAA